MHIHLHLCFVTHVSVYVFCTVIFELNYRITLFTFRVKINGDNREMLRPEMQHMQHTTQNSTVML